MHKAIVKTFNFRDPFRSLEVIRMLNTGFVAAPVFPGCLDPKIFMVLLSQIFFCKFIISL